MVRTKHHNGRSHILGYTPQGWVYVVYENGERIRASMYTHVKDIPLYKLPTGLDYYHNMRIEQAIESACLSGLHRLCTQIGAPDDWWDYVHTLPVSEWNKYKLEVIMPSLMEALCFPK